MENNVWVLSEHHTYTLKMRRPPNADEYSLEQVSNAIDDAAEDAGFFCFHTVVKRSWTGTIATIDKSFDNPIGKELLVKIATDAIAKVTGKESES
jgi:hypothetical protein